MQLHPDFEKLFDERLKAALQEHVKEKWFPIKTIFAGVIASLIAALIWAGVTSISTERSDDVTYLERVGGAGNEGVLVFKK